MTDLGGGHTEFNFEYIGLVLVRYLISWIRGQRKVAFLVFVCSRENKGERAEKG